MKRLATTTLALLFACAMIVGVRSAASANQLDFRLHNSGDHDILSVNVSPHGSPVWGGDVLGPEVLPSGDYTDIVFSGPVETCWWDIRVIYSDGDTGYDWDENLCHTANLWTHY